VYSLPASIERHPARARLLFHSVFSSTVLAVIASASAGSASWSIAVIWLLVYLSSALALELFVERVRRGSVSRLVTGKDVATLSRSLPPVEEMIAGSSRIEVLASTLKTFTEPLANIRALRERHRDGAHVRLLVLAPQGTGVEIAAAEHRDRGDRVEAGDLRQEIAQSIKRLLIEFSPDELKQILRLYTGSPHMAVTRCEDQYILVAYTHGRGGSSPSLALRRGPHEAFCEGLDRGFQELWEAPSTVSFDPINSAVAEVKP
jgi:hypothetical protein